MPMEGAETVLNIQEVKEMANSVGQINVIIDLFQQLIDNVHGVKITPNLVWMVRVV